METEFTPYLSLTGGILIGLSAVMLMGLMGRVMGATGIVAGVLSPVDRADWSWRAAVIAGMVSGPLALLMLTGAMPTVTIPISVPLILVGGFIVGIGVTYGSGCTSGHGVCGIARLSPRSIVATLIFMATTAATVFVIRHVIGA